MEDGFGLIDSLNASLQFTFCQLSFCFTLLTRDEKVADKSSKNIGAIQVDLSAAYDAVRHMGLTVQLLPVFAVRPCCGSSWE